MSVTIQKKIISFEVAGVDTPKSAAEATPEVAHTPPSPKSSSEKIAYMHEKVERSEVLSGSTYKIKTPVSEHAFYVTINDILLNPGTPYEKRRPFEMFINSKNMDHYQWISALTLIISAVFRKGGDITFLVKELQSVFDPKGGYFRKGGRFVPSLVAEIGDAIQSHLIAIGLLQPELDEHQKKFVAAQRKQTEQQQSLAVEVSAENDGGFPEGSQLCPKCNYVAMVVLDNCLTCLNCGESKCG